MRCERNETGAALPGELVRQELNTTTAFIISFCMMMTESAPCNVALGNHPLVICPKEELLKENVS